MVVRRCAQVAVVAVRRTGCSRVARLQSVDFSGCGTSELTLPGPFESATCRERVAEPLSCLRRLYAGVLVGSGSANG